MPFLAERDDAVLDGDEVALAEIPGRAVAARPVIVVRVELDEAGAAIAQQVERQQPHLVLQLALDIGDYGRSSGVVLREQRGAVGTRRPTVPAVSFARRFSWAISDRMTANCSSLSAVLPGAEIIAQSKEKKRERCGENGWNCATAAGHHNSKFGS